MDGLECKEVSLSQVNGDDGWFRLDSHYYRKQYIELKNKLSGMPHWFLKDIVLKPIQTGHTPSMKNEKYYGGKIAFIKTDNLHSNHIRDNFSDFLSDEGNSTIARTTLQEFDIITTIIGATEDVIARSALITSEHLPANINQNIVQIRVDNRIVFPEYVNTYLNTKFGREYLHYLSRQTEQVNLNCQEVGMVIIPDFSLPFQEKVKFFTTKATELEKDSKQLMNKSTEKININLNINSFSPSNKNISIRLFSDSFSIFDRSDAEFYQEKYDDYEKLIFSAPMGYTYVKNEFIPVKTKCSRTEKSYKYVEISNIEIGTGNSTMNCINTEDLPDNAKIMTRKGDLLVSTVRPNRGAVAILESENVLVSGAFTVLREKSDYPKEVLQTLFRTPLYKDWLLRFNVGTSYPVIKDEDVLNMPIPLFDEDVKETIVYNVRKACFLRNQSKQLLEYAKQAVEMAIEQGEDTALAWLKLTVSDLEV